MPAQNIDITDDSWNIVFKFGERLYRADSLIFSSIVMDKTKGDDEPSREVILEAMRGALDTTEGLTDHQLFAMSVRMTKAMARAGNE